jgi:hypothetical protein
MATKKVNTYIGQELDWLEGKANELKQYVDDRPFHKLIDRIHFKETKNGGAMPMISATIESQLAALTKALKEYAEIIRVVNEMREQEDKKQQMRKGFENEDILDDDN